MSIFEVTPLDGERGLHLEGELDSLSVSQFKEAVAQMPAGGQMKLDLSGLTFIDSSGLHAIVEFAGAENGNGRVLLEGVPPMLVPLFEITKLTEYPQLDIRGDTNGR